MHGIKCTCRVLQDDKWYSLKEAIIQGVDISLFVDSEAMDLTCPLPYKQIEYSALGCFQLEGATAKKWLPKFRPQNIEEISDFTSLARTGPLEAGMMDEYVKVKNGDKEASFIHMKLQGILGSTKGTLIYQEQVLKICNEISGMTLSESDTVRKAVGKKDKKLMESCKESFTKGCAASGVEVKTAEEIWSWIDVMSGYSFNLSHAMCYSYLAYKTAWMKSHFPIEFYTAALCKTGLSTTEQGEEVKELVNDAKIHDVKVVGPNVTLKNTEFTINNSDEIVMGLGHIKGIGAAAIKKVLKAECGSWSEFLKDAIKNLNKTTVDGLIWSGALDAFKISRQKMSTEYKSLCALTERELEIVTPKLIKGVDITVLLKNFFNVTTINSRKAAGEEVPMLKRCAAVNAELEEISKETSSVDISTLLAREKFLLGITFSANEVDMYSSAVYVNDCKEFVTTASNTKMSFMGVIESVRIHVDKSKREMAFISFSDSTYMIDGGVIFASVFAKIRSLIEKDKIVLFKGKKQDNSFLVDEVKSVF